MSPYRFLVDPISNCHKLLISKLPNSIGTSNLWFSGWTPSTVGGTVGTAIGLFFFAVFSRFLSTIRSKLARSWAHPVFQAREQQTVEKNFGYVGTPFSKGKQVPPFMFSYDFPRGVVFMAESTYLIVASSLITNPLCCNVRLRSLLPHASRDVV